MVTVFALTMMALPCAGGVTWAKRELGQFARLQPPNSSDPGCQPFSTDPEMLTVSAGAEGEGVPMTRSVALISMGAARPPAAAAVNTSPAIPRVLAVPVTVGTLSTSIPASAGKVGRTVPAAVAAALK